MSCDSGLPDFRGKRGFYRIGSNEIKMEAVNFHEEEDGVDILTTWGFVTQMMLAFRTKRPHKGYTLLLELLREKNYFVFTSNIDGYFEIAGFDPCRLHECHGNLETLQCTSVGAVDDDDEDNENLDSLPLHELKRRARLLGVVNVEGHRGRKRTWVNAIRESTKRRCDATVWNWPSSTPLPQLNKNDRRRLLTRESIPTCPSCGRLARPNVSHVTDEDKHIHRELHGASHDALKNWLCQHENRSILIIEVGCGTSVHSLREETDLLIRRRLNRGVGTSLIRVDPSNCRVPLPSKGPNAPSYVGLGLTALEAFSRISKSLSDGTAHKTRE